jgi:hypothetical protein
MDSSDADTIELIPIERITVINPRVRNKKIFKEITANIAELGLKRPITVTRRDDADGPRYALVCGQGRLEAYQALGQHESLPSSSRPTLRTAFGSQSGKRRERPLSSNALIRAYQEDVDRKRILIRKAETTRNRLIFVTEAIRKLIVDENFVTLLRAEGIETLPRNLAARIEAGVKA